MRRERTAITRGEVPIFKKLVAEGYSPQSIARRMDIHTKTVHKFFKQLEVDPAKNTKSFPEDAQFTRRLVATDNYPVGANTGASDDTLNDQLSNETELQAPKPTRVPVPAKGTKE